MEKKKEMRNVADDRSEGIRMLSGKGEKSGRFPKKFPRRARS